jgi:hypothetical protein
MRKSGWNKVNQAMNFQTTIDFRYGPCLTPARTAASASRLARTLAPPDQQPSLPLFSSVNHFRVFRVFRGFPIRVYRCLSVVKKPLLQNEPNFGPFRTMRLPRLPKAIQTYPRFSKAIQACKFSLGMLFALRRSYLAGFAPFARLRPKSCRPVSPSVAPLSPAYIF